MPPKRRTDGDAPTTTDAPATQEAPQSPPPVADPVPESPTGTVDDSPEQAEPVPDKPPLEETVARIAEEYGPALDLLERLDRSDTGGQIQAIHPAFWAIMRDVQGIGKHGQMRGGGGDYKFRRYDDLKRELGAACRTHGVMLQSEILDVVNERIDARKTRVQVTVQYRFTSLMDGSELGFQSVGESIDTSDKASSKAMTMALKTALDQAFMLAAEDIEDPDASRPDLAPEDNRGPLARTPERVMADAEQRVYREGDPVPPGGHRVGDQRQVGGTTFVKHSDGPAYPNNAPQNPADPWDKGAPDTRTDAEKAQAAADKLAKPDLTLAQWTNISNAAQQMGLMEQLVRTPHGDQMALKHWMVAVGRTL